MKIIVISSPCALSNEAFIFQRFVLIDQIENKINLALSFITGYQSQNKIDVVIPLS